MITEQRVQGLAEEVYYLVGKYSMFGMQGANTFLRSAIENMVAEEVNVRIKAITEAENKITNNFKQVLTLLQENAQTAKNTGINLEAGFEIKKDTAIHYDWSIGTKEKEV